MSIFDNFQKADNSSGFNKRLTFDENAESVKSGKAVFKGDQILGILTDRRQHNGKTFGGDPKIEHILTIATFEDPNDASCVTGKKPDGETFDLFAHDSVIKQLDTGKNGVAAKVGDLVIIKCNGKKRSAKGNQFWDYEVYFRSIDTEVPVTQAAQALAAPVSSEY